MELLAVRGLTVAYPRGRQRTRVVDDVSFAIRKNEVLGLVGESGSGKTVTATAIMRLGRPPAQIEAGQIIFQGDDLLQQSEARLQRVRGGHISMIFQSPRTSLNPLMKVGDQIARVYALHAGLRGGAARAEAVKMLQMVGISDPETRYETYPHQLSGGMCQRVMIAMALACKPDLLIADEPTTGLDVTIEAQIFDLIKELQAQIGMSVLLITHDLGVVADICHRVAVMHGGHIVEMGDVRTIFKQQKHPYSNHLLGSLLRIDRDVVVSPEQLAAAGRVDYATPGCRYAQKCPSATDTCRRVKPAVTALAPGHTVMCHLYGEGK